MSYDYSIEIRNLTKQYGKKDIVFSNMNLKLPLGEVIGLIGENGSGKTTFIKLISGMTQQNSGEIFVLGSSLCDENSILSLRSHISILGDANRALYWNISGMDNIEYFWTLKTGKSLKKMPVFVKDNIERFNMSSFIDKKVEAYSKGMKQRLLLLISLLNQPQILFMDEPLNGLDFENAFILKQIISEYTKKSGATVIVTSHDQHFINEVCDSQYLIRDKQIVKCDTFSPTNKEITLFVRFKNEKDKQIYIDSFSSSQTSIDNNILKIVSKLNDSELYQKLSQDIRMCKVEIMEVR